MHATGSFRSRVSPGACRARMLWVPFAALTLVCCTTTLPKTASVTDPRAVYAWTAPACPSGQVVAPAVIPAIVAALATPALTDLVSGLVGIPISAIQAAAAADKSGYSASGQNPRYFFPSVKVDPAGKDPPKFTSPGCYVVAYTKYVVNRADSSAQSWCADASFSAALPEACTEDGKARLGKLGPALNVPGGYGPRVPDFYAEVEIHPSTYVSNAAWVGVPRVIAMYYPHSLLEAASKKPRTVTITVTLTSGAGAGSSDPTKTASAGVVLANVVPGDPITQDSLAAQQSSWVSVPRTLSLTSNDPPPTNGAPYYPVNIATSIKEVGDPSAFLQAFATAVNSSSSDYTKAIVNTISPAAIAAAQQQAASNSASAMAASAQAFTDLGKYLSSCSPAPTSAAAKAAAQGAYQTVLADRQKANATAMTAGISPPYSSVEQGLTQCF
jgi:hypothetical protein